jgi:tRNA(Ile)-lysidine synthase
MDTLVTRIQTHISHILLNEGLTQARVILALSGGLDSTVLLHVLTQCREQYPLLDITAVTIDHGWRGRPAPELPHIMGCCKAWGIPLVWVTAPTDLPKTELAARQFRYDQLSLLGDQLQAAAVLTAHHATDQVETVLFRLCRGTGVHGLTGMSVARRLTDTTRLIRPLLPFSRIELEGYAQAFDLKGYVDPTNMDMTYTRNALRHQVLPVLRQHFPHVDNALVRLSQLAQDAITLLDYQLADVMPTIMANEHTLRLQPFSQLSPALQRPILRRFLAPYEPDLSLEQTDHLLTSLLDERDEDGALFSLGVDPATGRDRFVSLYRGDITVRVQPEPIPASFPVVLTQPFGVCGLAPNCSQFDCVPVSDKQTYLVDNTWRLLANLRPFMHLPIVWRTREPGDRIRVEGSQTSQKLKDYLMDQNVHRFDRDALLLLACGRNVLWIPGLVRSADIIPTGEHPTHYLTCWVEQPLFTYEAVNVA